MGSFSQRQCRKKPIPIWRKCNGGGMSFHSLHCFFMKGALMDNQRSFPISLPQVATGLRSRLPGSFRRRGFQPDLLMPQEALFARGAHSMQTAMRRALLRRGRSGNAAFSKIESNVAGNLCRMCRKEESRHGDFSLHNQNSGRSKGKSVISASAYLNGDVMKNRRNREYQLLHF